MSNLRLINETSISSSVETFDVTDVFSSDFDIYKITATNLSTTGTDYTTVNMQLINSAGNVITAGTQYKYSARVNLAWGASGDNKSNALDFIYSAFSESTDQAPSVAGGTVWVFNPYSSSEYTQVLFQNSNSYGPNYYTSYFGGGWLVSNISIKGFRAVVNNSGRPLASGTFRTYGLRVDK